MTKLDLTGQKFGHLTALSPAENIGGRTAWLCRCDCGSTFVAKTVHLRRGHVKTCGCIAIKERLTLVDGTCLELLRSKTVRKNNTSSVPGVEWLQKEARWRATICFKGKRTYLGRFATFQEAVKARKTAEEQFHDAFVAQVTQEFF